MKQPYIAAPTHREAVENRLGLRMAAHLQRGADALPHDITERLRFGREQALEKARAARRQVVAATTAAPTVLMQGNGMAGLGGPPSLWLRLASVLPLVVLIAGLVFIQYHHDSEQVAVAAEIDTALLSDELPPDAYGDPGFAEFLRNAVDH
ncbi:MAG: DUF3619 family protein [Burkholderiales bacterium]|nr:DUF3619 family protein [Burkholderiales bacterium]